MLRIGVGIAPEGILHTRSFQQSRVRERADARSLVGRMRDLPGGRAVSQKLVERDSVAGGATDIAEVSIHLDVVLVVAEGPVRRRVGGAGGDAALASGGLLFGGRVGFEVRAAG
jgi:hypothetical protein